MRLFSIIRAACVCCAGFAMAVLSIGCQVNGNAGGAGNPGSPSISAIRLAEIRMSANIAVQGTLLLVPITDRQSLASEINATATDINKAVSGNTLDLTSIQKLFAAEVAATPVKYRAVVSTLLTSMGEIVDAEVGDISSYPSGSAPEVLRSLLIAVTEGAIDATTAYLTANPTAVRNPDKAEVSIAN